jgi:hypothetical protein
VARRLSGAVRCIDVVLTRAETDKTLGVECKYQGGGGSAEEKVPATIQGYCGVADTGHRGVRRRGILP